MKLSLLVAATAATVIGSALALRPGPHAHPGRLRAEGPQGKVSYGFGLNIGKRFKKDGSSSTPRSSARGLVDGFTGGKSLLSEAEIQQAMADFEGQLKAKQAEQP